jgi:hypothetical protein
VAVDDVARTSACFAEIELGILCRNDLKRSILNLFHRFEQADDARDVLHLVDIGQTPRNPHGHVTIAGIGEATVANDERR